MQLFIKDESTDHIHVIISTEETKTQRFKNRYGEGEKKVTSLNAKRFDRTYLIDLHTRYANHNKSLACIVELGIAKQITKI